MSRAYRVLIPLAQLNPGSKKDVVMDFELLPILPLDGMREMLAEQLTERGAREQGGVLVLVRKSGAEVRVDLEAQQITIRVAHLGGQNVEVWVDEESLNRDQLARAAGGTVTIGSKEELQKLGEHVKRVAESTSAQLQQLLVQESHRARQELNVMLRDVYRDAVTRKARSMGNVTSVTESEEDGEYRVRIELES